MQSLYNDKEAQNFTTDLELRVYTSRLLGQDSSLVLHGGGNTSVKSKVINLFGEEEDILFVKGSGWDLATIEAEGFAPVKMDMLLKMAALDTLSDSDMVKYQRAAMIDPSAPNPSVEAILHAIIPFKFVDHTHTDAVVTITNTDDGKARIEELYGKKVLIIPYIMPGFVLAQLVYQMTKEIDWNDLEGMVLMNHGLFTFADDAKVSYEKTIELVEKAERYLQEKKANLTLNTTSTLVDTLNIATLRKEVSAIKGHATIVKINQSPLAVTFAKCDIERIAKQGPLTPDHVIRTKRTPALLEYNFKEELEAYVKEYKAYFNANKKAQTALNPAPNFAIYKDIGSIAFGKNIKEATIIDDIAEHTFEAILKAEKLGGYKALDASKIFEVEYWELEQAKLKKATSFAEFTGKVAIVTGAASAMGAASAKMLNAKGCAVIALDSNPEITSRYTKADFIGVECDLTNEEDIQKAVSLAVLTFGGLDIVVSSAGNVIPNETLDTLSDDNWNESIRINLTSHQKLLKASAPFLKLGIESAVVMLASTNSLSAEKGTAAYSVAQAAQAQLARIAAVELSEFGVRVNTAQTHTLSDTTVDNVAELVCAMAGKVFAKTTGAQVSIDGGSGSIL